MFEYVLLTQQYLCYSLTLVSTVAFCQLPESEALMWLLYAASAGLPDVYTDGSCS